MKPPQLYGEVFESAVHFDALTGIAAIAPPTTGRYLVSFPVDDDDPRPADFLKSVAGMAAATARDFESSAVNEAALEKIDALVFDGLRVALVAPDLDQEKALSAFLARARQPTGVSMEPERVYFAEPSRDLVGSAERLAAELGENPDLFAAATGPGGVPREFTTADGADEGRRRGDWDPYRAGLLAGIRLLLSRLEGTVSAAGQRLTWGLQAIGCASSPLTGAGVRVAVLDTGVDLRHPDLTGRIAASHSFVDGEAVQDGNGHGTHCVGTACGPRRPASGPGYGVAPEAELYVGKVLNDDGRGAGGWILAGLNWAVENQCRVASMSIQAPVQEGERYDAHFERAAGRAIARGTLPVGAAGNYSKRRAGIVRPVAHPANCPSIMAVAALDENVNIANFSNGGSNTSAAGVDIAAPGVDILSSWPGGGLRSESGTSMATPHVAGAAALYFQAGEATPEQVWSRLVRNARRLPLPSQDVASGLVRVAR